MKGSERERRKLKEVARCKRKLNVAAEAQPFKVILGFKKAVGMQTAF